MHRRATPFLLLILFSQPCAFARPPSGSYESFRVKTDNTPQAEIDGWYLPAGRDAKGTVFLLHGYNNSKEFMVGWEWIRDREHWNVVMFDFREHGASTHSLRLSSLGYHEIWDVKAVVDWAQQRKLPQPFVIYGRSLGAATGLRWASMDPRISGVLAISPFKNAELATRQIADYGASLVTSDKLNLSTGSRTALGQLAQGYLHDLLDRDSPLPDKYRAMLRQVDIPAAVKNRHDLRIWILVGEADAFPPADQREILAASASPAGLKRLVIAPGMNHRTVWTFKGAGNLPSHDQYVRQFLAASLGRSAELGVRTGIGTPIAILSAAMLLGVIAILTFRRRLRMSTVPQGS